MAKQNTTIQQKNKHYLLYLLFILIAFVFYGNSIKNGYSLDDELVTSTDVKKNPLVEDGISGILKIFQSRFANDGEQNYAYRPITTLSFAIEHSIVGESTNTAHISHFVSVLLYGLCGILLYLFLLKLFKGEAKWFSAIVVVIYLIHPIHTEIVDNIKTRDELLAMIFCLSATINVFNYYDKRKLKYLIFAVLLLGLGLLSRPSAKVFIGLIPLSLYFFRAIKIKTLALYFFGIFACLVMIQLFSKLMIEVPSVRHHEYFENPLRFLSYSHKIPMFFYTISRYILILLVPYPLKYYYGYNDFPMIGFSDWEFYICFIIVVFLLYLIWKGFKQKTVFSYSLLFFFFGIGGVANLLSPAAGIFAERFANFASIGFILAIVVLVFKWQKWDIRMSIPTHKRNTVYSVLVVLAIPTLLYVTNRNHDWRSKMSLYRTDIKKLKNSTKAHSLLATEYMFKALDLYKSNNISLYQSALKYADSAQYHFQKSVEIYPQYASSWNNLAVYQFNFKNNYDSAIVIAKKTIKIDSTYKQGYYNLGNSYAKTAVLYNWLKNILKDTTNIDLPENTIARANQIINTSKIKKAIVPLMKIENMANKLKTKAVPSNQILGFAQYINVVSQLEGKYLPKIKLSTYIEKLNEIPQMNRANYIEQLFDRVHTYLLTEIHKMLPEQLSSSGAVFSLFNHNINAYTDSTYFYLKKLQHIDPKFGRVYEAAFSFSKSFMNVPQMVYWCNSFIKAFPDKSRSMIYLQIAYAYYSQKNRDRCFYYYDLSLKAFQEELHRLNNSIEKTSQQRQEAIRLKQRIKSIDTFLGEAQNKPDSLLFKQQ